MKDDEECDETFYKSAVRMFGIEKVFQIIQEFAPLDAEWADIHSNAHYSWWQLHVRIVQRL